MTNSRDASEFFARSEQRWRWSFTLLVLGCVGWLGCASDKDAGEQDQNELNAILKDGDLTVLTRSALMPATPPGIPIAGAGGAIIFGGVGGAGGSSFGVGGAIVIGTGGAPQQDGGAGNMGTAGQFGTGGRGTGGFFPGDGGMGNFPGQ
jgi:hypothetical protein